MAVLDRQLWWDINRPCVDGQPHRWNRRWCQHCNLVLPKRKGARSRVIKVFLRDGPDCHYCGAELDASTRTMDHKVPLSRGGSNALSNLVMACYPCNADKADMDYHEYLKSRRLREYAL